MKKKKLQVIVFTCLCLALAPALQAQPTPAEAQDLRDEAMLRVGTFMRYVEIISSRNEDQFDAEIKQMAIERALVLFKPEAKVEFTPTQKGSSRFYDLEEYLHLLKNDIDRGKEYFFDVFPLRPDNLRPVPGSDHLSAGITSVYNCRYYYDKTGQPHAEYVDKGNHRKLQEIVVKNQDFPTGSRYSILLGNISVME